MKPVLNKIKQLPTSPGVYIFCANGVSVSGGKNKSDKVLYVGKAASLKDRVGSYFNGRNEFARPVDFAIDQIQDIEIKRTDSVLEAYFLEQELIKKYQPKYNVLGKDDKSFVYVCLTNDEFPRFEVRRKTDLFEIPNNKFQITNKSQKINTKITSRPKEILNTKYPMPYTRIYGPYTSRLMIEEALKILRKIFPFHSRKQKTEKGCLDSHLGLCPAPYEGKISKKDYLKNIRAIEMVLKGKKKSLVSKLEKQMHKSAENQEFERAAVLRNTVFALRHIRDVALIGEREVGESFENYKLKIKNFRIEGYDISNISGKFATGSMVVFDNLEDGIRPNKKEYRKFQIKTVSNPNDVSAMEEMLRRRLRNEWKTPNLILLDGGKGHLNAAKRVFQEHRFNIPILAVAKGPTRKKIDLYSYGKIPNVLNEKLITQIRDEAHRFAISYHRMLRQKII